MKCHSWYIESCDLCKLPIQKDQWMWATRESNERTHYACKFPGVDPGPIPGPYDPG